MIAWVSSQDLELADRQALEELEHGSGWSWLDALGRWALAQARWPF